MSDRERLDQLARAVDELLRMQTVYPRPMNPTNRRDHDRQVRTVAELVASVLAPAPAPATSSASSPTT